jgi:hypothetical protein
MNRALEVRLTAISLTLAGALILLQLRMEAKAMRTNWIVLFSALMGTAAMAFENQMLLREMQQQQPQQRPGPVVRSPEEMEAIMKLPADAGADADYERADGGALEQRAGRCHGRSG